MHTIASGQENPTWRAIGIAIQALEELPDHLRTMSNIADLRRMLAGEDTGRDGVIAVQAIALALAFRTQTAMLSGQSPMSEARGVGFNNRLQEFAAIFDLIRHCSSPQMLAMAYVEACQSVRNTQLGDDGSDR